MRRQAWLKCSGARVVRSASALQVWLWLLIFVFQNEFRISKSIQPGYLDFDNLPETNFTCEGKVIGGYYADLETSCQMFHVCTVGQQDEPMDIKFLCLNGTVFDQETRVCERVDEVDCTKSEKFYSLNLELYGNTIAPPTIKANDTKTTTAEAHHFEKHDEEDIEPTADDSPHHKPDNHHDYQDTTEDPIQESKPTQNPHNLVQPTNPADIGFSEHVEPVEENQEEEEIDSEDPEYEDYSVAPTTTTQNIPTTTRKKIQTTTQAPLPSTQYPPALIQRPVSSPSPPHPSISLPTSSTSSSNPQINPSQLSPQEFTYHHRNPGSEAISFQIQGFRPADGVYITHAPPQQFDHFQYESSRTGPRPTAPQSVPFVKRPSPTPFRATTLDPHDQLLRPVPTSQPSNRHETTIKHHQPQYQSQLPAQRPLPFQPYYYDRKRSDDESTDNESSLAARSVGPLFPERPPPKPKSPPRVIVTASASVSDSNGKRLNYTVGNVVSAVKPIVNINYDDYKESDLIFDPFFLDVPKLQKRRKSRGSRSTQINAHARKHAHSPSKANTQSQRQNNSRINRNVFSIAATPTVSPVLEVINTSTTSKVTSQATTTEKSTSTTTKTTTTTATWSPDDYVDDNYEPIAYAPSIHPLSVLMPADRKIKKERHSYNHIKENKNLDHEKNTGPLEGLPPSLRVALSTSSQRTPVVLPLAPAPPSLLKEPSGANTRSK